MLLVGKLTEIEVLGSRISDGEEGTDIGTQGGRNDAEHRDELSFRWSSRATSNLVAEPFSEAVRCSKLSSKHDP